MTDLGRLAVLVVDDELLIRWAIAETLRTCGHGVAEASDAATARQVLDGADGQIDVVLLDVRLPDSDDLRLLTEIRERSPATAIVVMTALGMADLQANALSMGAHAVIEKPFDINVIEPLVRHAHAARR
jgi:two-component system NtrC family response regulator